jgi:hypothetical protein
MDTLAIGDCHGHYDRLEALLLQESIINENDERINKDVEVVHLGDLGHFGSEMQNGKRVPGSSTADLLCWQAVAKHWIDIVLWGNHDRAVASSRHAFGGYIEPPTPTRVLMEEAREEDRLRLAHAAHGFLLTHAGLAKVFKYNKAPDGAHDDPAIFAEWVNKADVDTDSKDVPFWSDFEALRDAIGIKRGGYSSTGGGILWRDATESLYPKFRQIFGHTKGDRVRKYPAQDGWSYCIDIGDQNNGRLAGIWLPSEKIVEVEKIVEIDMKRW